MYVDGEDDDSLMEIDDPASDFEEGGKKKKTARKPKEVGKKAKWQDVYDEDGNDLEEKKKARQLKKEQNDKKKALKAAQKETQIQLNNPNMIKTSNKLIGEIFNQDLYNSDDSDTLKHDLDMPAIQHQQSFRNEELDLGTVQKAPQKKMDFLIKKIQDKKQSGVEQQAINLGLV